MPTYSVIQCLLNRHWIRFKPYSYQFVLIDPKAEKFSTASVGVVTQPFPLTLSSIPVTPATFQNVTITHYRKKSRQKFMCIRPVKVNTGSPCASRIWRSLSVPSNTLPVSLKSTESSSSRGNRESFSHVRTSSRLKEENKRIRCIYRLDKLH